MAVNVKDLIDLSRLGKTMLLVEPPEPYTKYVDGQRTDEIEGYRYSIVLVDHNYDKIQVKIEEQNPSITVSEGKPVKVKLENLDVFPFAFNNRVNLSFKASSISEVK